MAAAKNREKPGRSADAKKTAPTPSKRRRWLAVPAVLAVLAWFLPGIAAHTSLLPWGLQRAVGGAGTLSIRSASLGWFSPIAVQGVEMQDADGKPLFTLAAAGTDRSLLGLLFDSGNLGHVRLESPQLTLVLRDDGSNVEDVLANFRPPPAAAEKPSSRVGLCLDVVDGSLSVSDRRTGGNWQLDKLTATVELSSANDGLCIGQLSAELADARRPGNITASAKLTPAGSQAKLRAANVPLAMFRAVAARFAPGTTLGGQLSADVQASWGDQGGAASRAEGDLSIENFALATPALQNDQPRIARLHAAAVASWRPDRVEIERSSVDCELGTASFSGTLPWDAKGGWSPVGFLRQRHELSGRVDIARLARLLPATLRLRQQVEIGSGQVQWTLSGHSGNEGMQWHGQLEAAHLTARAAGRPITWERPISLGFDVHETPEGPVVEGLRCEADFLKVLASGTPEMLTAQWRCNLRQMSDQLGQFVDLGAAQCSGVGWGNLNWKHPPGRPFDADGELHLHNFHLALAEGPPWQEDDLLLLVSAKGQVEHAALTRLDSATAKITAGTEQVDAQLARPVEKPGDGSPWPLRVTAQGQLQDWPGRLAAWLPMTDCRLTGSYKLKAEVTLAAELVELRQATLALEPLIVAAPRCNVNEPRLEVTLAGSWDRSRGRLQVEPASLTCATLGLQASHVTYSAAAGGPPDVAGTLNYQADAGRLRQWFTDPARRASWQLAGQFHGTAELHRAAGLLHGELHSEVSNLAVVDASGQQFQEPHAQLLARADYQPKGRIVELGQLELTSSALTTNITGRIAPAGGLNNADLKGQVNYDLERLSGLLRPWLGGIRLVGRGSSPVFYRGPFALAAGSAAAGLNWDSANLCGLQLGRGELKATMGEGAARIEPLRLAAGQGRLCLAPTVRLAPEPIELNLPRGPLAERIQANPELCSTVLKYIAPVLADVTTAQGEVSLDVAGCRVPLGDLTHGEAAGRLMMHSLEVSPGPLVRQLAVFLGREAPARLRPESAVLFRMVGGRVYHQGLELVFPDFSIRTYGWVGLDQTLSLMAEMPVPAKWLVGRPLLAQAAQNQTIRVPITGTLSQPQLDQKVMAELSRQFLQKAAGNMFQGELNRQLDRLFGPKK
jgi:hypothetical protein